MKKERKQYLKYNEEIRKYEEYFSVSYYEAYIELIRVKKQLNEDFKQLVASLPIETIKQEKALIQMQKDLSDFDKVKTRVEYYNENSREMFRKLTDFIDLEEFVEKYDFILKYDSYNKSDKNNLGRRILKALAKEFDILMQNNKSFRNLVIILLFSVKGSRFFTPIIQTVYLRKGIEEKKVIEYHKKLYDLLEEERKKGDD